MYSCVHEVSNEDWLSEWQLDASTATESVECCSLSSSSSTCRPESLVGDFASRYHPDVACSWVEWDVILELAWESPSKSIGLEVVPTMDGTALAVTSIESNGEVAAWNASNPLHHIRLGDVVLQVNIVSENSEEMLRELLAVSEAPALSATLRIARARSVQIPALESCSGAGIVVAKQVQATRMQDSSPLQIVSVSDALVAQQQELSRTPELCIWPGDVVMAVNGCQEADEIVRELERAPRLAVTLQRPVPGTFEAYMAANQYLMTNDAKGHTKRAGTLSAAVGKAFQVLGTAMMRPLRSQARARSKETVGATPIDVASNYQDDYLEAVRLSTSGRRLSSPVRHMSSGASPSLASNHDSCEAVRVSLSGRRWSSLVRHASSVRSRLSDRCQGGTTSVPVMHEILL